MVSVGSAIQGHSACSDLLFSQVFVIRAVRTEDWKYVSPGVIAGPKRNLICGRSQSTGVRRTTRVGASLRLMLTAL